MISFAAQAIMVAADIAMCGTMMRMSLSLLRRLCDHRLSGSSRSAGTVDNQVEVAHDPCTASMRPWTSSSETPVSRGGAFGWLIQPVA